MDYNMLPDISKITDEEINMLANNLDAIYVYLDLYIDSMTDEEVLNWEYILDIIEKITDKKQ